MDGLDDTQRSFYGLKFENTFLREKGKSFENFFARVMAHGFTDDFEPVLTLRSQGRPKVRRLPAERQHRVPILRTQLLIKLPDLLRKIDEDFDGARTHWSAKMKRWEFVHNDVRGLPAEAVRKLDDLRAAHPQIRIAVFGEAEMRAPL